MKYILPLGMALLIGMGVYLRHSPVDPSVQERNPVAGQGAEWSKPMLVKEEPRTALAGLAAETGSVSWKAADPVSPVVVPAKAPVMAWRKVLGSLTGPLSLTEVQNTVIEGILRRREDEIKELHDGYRKAGVIELRQFEWQVGLLKRDWFQRIDAVLDSNQHDRFVVLIEQGLFNESLAFNVDPGMTILE